MRVKPMPRLKVPRISSSLTRPAAARRIRAKMSGSSQVSVRMTASRARPAKARGRFSGMPPPVM